MANPEYTKEFVFDIDAYLIESYPKMNMATRRAVCTIALTEWMDEELLTDLVDSAVAQYAMSKLQIEKAEEEDYEDEEDETVED